MSGSTDLVMWFFWKIIYENSLCCLIFEHNNSFYSREWGGYSLKQKLNVLLHSTFEYHSVLLAENTFEYLAIEFPFKANHPWDRWLAGPLSLTLGLLVQIQTFEHIVWFFSMCLQYLNILKPTPFHLVQEIFWDEEIPAAEGRGERACCLRCKSGRKFSVVEVNWKLFKGNTTPMLSGRNV